MEVWVSALFLTSLPLLTQDHALYPEAVFWLRSSALFWFSSQNSVCEAACALSGCVPQASSLSLGFLTYFCGFGASLYINDAQPLSCIPDPNYAADC